ncbi:MAG: gamma-glutamyltransferase [Candidatus Methylomirabilia bacterium]
MSVANRPEPGRALTLAPRGVVTCPHALASEAGVEVLKAGGSAVDAAIAANAALSVLYPHGCGIGGDAFWLIYDARQRSVQFLNSSGRAPATATLESFRERGLSEIPFRGLLSVTVPGAVDGWITAHARYGRLPFPRLFEAAVGYAREGFPVTERVANYIEEALDLLRATPDTARMYLKDGRTPREGERLIQPDLARTLEAVATGGREAFYEGEIAREICRYSQEHGGLHSERDFAAQRSEWGEPLATTYRGVTIYQTPPNTQGLTLLLLLNMLEGDELGSLEYLGADYVHLLVEAKKLAFADRKRYIADPAFAKVPVAELISKEYAGQRRALIDPRRAARWKRVEPGSLAGDTVYIATVDAEGNAVSLIQSVYGVFGSGVVAGRTGVLLHNRGAYFSLDPSHPNRLEPGKRPLHTLMASLAFRNGQLWGVFGTMGADGQPQIHLQVYSAMIDFGLNLQEAIEAPRWLSGRFYPGDPQDLLNLEGRFPAHTLTELEARGHIVDRWGPWHRRAGHAHGIILQPDTGTRMGAADPRSDGAAIGY